MRWMCVWWGEKICNRYLLRSSRPFVGLYLMVVGFTVVSAVTYKTAGRAPGCSTELCCAVACWRCWVFHGERCCAPLAQTHVSPAIICRQGVS